MRAILVAAAGVSVCPRCAAPARQAAATPTVETWTQEGLSGRRYLTEHFDLVSTIRDKEFESALPGFLEAVYRQCADTLRPSTESPPRLAVYVFGVRSEWERFAHRRFLARYDVYARIRSGGFTEGTTSVSFHVSRAGTLATLAHEVWHQYVGANVKSPIPAWLNEGLACLHESVRTTNAKFIFTPRENSFRINSLREAIQTDRLIPLAQLVDTDAGEVITRNQSTITQTYYAQAWSLVTFLRWGANGRYARAFEQLLADIADDTFRVRMSAATLAAGGEADTSSQRAAFEAYFGMPPEQLADAYYDHLVRLAGF